MSLGERDAVAALAALAKDMHLRVFRALLLYPSAHCCRGVTCAAIA